MSQAFRLMLLIGEVDDALVEAVAPPRRSRINPLPFIAAAVLALVFLGGGTAFLIWNRNPSSSAAASGDTAIMAAAEENKAKEAAESAPAMEPAAPEAVFNTQGAEDAAEAEEAAVIEDAAEAPAPDPQAGTGSDDVTDQLGSMMLGPVRLGMSEAEVLAALGPADDTSNSGPVTYEDGITRFSWFYNLSGSADVHYDLQITLADDGSGYVVDEIFATEHSGLTLDHRITLGDSESQIQQLDLPYEMTEETRSETDAGGQEYSTVVHHYSIRSGDRWLNIDTEDGIVECIDLGRWYYTPPYEETP